MAKLKGVIFGWNNVLGTIGSIGDQKAMLREVGKLMRFLQSQDIEIIAATNKPYFVESDTEKTPVKEYFEKRWKVKIDHRICAEGRGSGRQSGVVIQGILNDKGWAPNEAVFVGNREADQQSAINSDILLLNAKWFPDVDDSTPYGLHFESPKEIAKFIDVLCLREHEWYFKLEEGPLRVYSLAPFGTFDRYLESKYYSNDFLNNVKHELEQDKLFWGRLLATSLYLSGVYQEIDYITSYPKHQAEGWPEVLIDPLDAFAKCFRGRYIPDLIIRHTTATKSQTNRDSVDHANQLNTICLNKNPTKIVKKEKQSYSTFPIKKGKTVLVIDDVLSKGMSFEAARSYLEKTGAKVVCLSFLKTRNYGYHSLAECTLKNAFVPNVVLEPTLGTTYGYSQHLVNQNAASNLDEMLRRYQNWDWPEEIN